ncbi:MAG: DUF3068 domain-containing protein [Marmoricola sp.]
MFPDTVGSASRDGSPRRTTGRERVMRRLSVVLIAVGAFLVVLAPMIRFYAYPRLAVAPANQVSETGLQATGAQVFDISTLKTITADLKIQVITHGDASTPKSHPDDVTYVNSTLTKTSDGKLLSGEIERMSFDKRTGQASSCCKDFIADEKDAPGVPVTHEGLVAKFPFQTEKKTYQFWDSTLRTANPIYYKGTSKLEGLTVYKFEQTIAPTQYGTQEVPLSLLGLPGDSNVTAPEMYSNTRTLWVEPETGVIIQRQENQLNTMDYQGAPRVTLTKAVISYDDKTLRKNVDDYGAQGSRLKLARSTGPELAFVLGLVSILAGIVMGRRRQTTGGARVKEMAGATA